MSASGKVSVGLWLTATLWNRSVQFGCLYLMLGVMIVGWRVYLSDMDLPLARWQSHGESEMASGVVVRMDRTPYDWGRSGDSSGTVGNCYRITYAFTPAGRGTRIAGVSYKTLTDPSSWDGMKVQVRYAPTNPSHSEMVSGEGRPASAAELLWLIIPALGLYLLCVGIRAGRHMCSLLRGGDIARGRLARATRARLLQSMLSDGSTGVEEDDAVRPEYGNTGFAGYAFEFTALDGRTYSAISNRTEPVWQGYLGDNDPLLVMSRLLEQVKKIDRETIRKAFLPQYETVAKQTRSYGWTGEPPCLDDPTLIRIARELGLSLPEEYTGPVHSSDVSLAASAPAPEDHVIYDPRNPDDAVILSELCPSCHITEAGSLSCSLASSLRALILPALALCVTAATIYMRVKQGVL